MVDDIYAEGAKTWDWETNVELTQWADSATLHPMTIWKLGSGETKLPQLLTVWKLAKSVGWNLEFGKGRKLKLRKRAA
jgi:hypothetical protein